MLGLLVGHHLHVLVAEGEGGGVVDQLEHRLSILALRFQARLTRLRIVMVLSRCWLQRLRTCSRIRSELSFRGHDELRFIGISNKGLKGLLTA